MPVFLNILWFAAAALMMWVASGIIIRGIERLSALYHVARFSMAFILLGLVTSITEMSVGVNALMHKTPGIFVGNLIGGVFAILMLLIPLLALLNRGLSLNKHLDGPRLWLFAVLLFAPTLVTVDSVVTRIEAATLIVFYGLFVTLFHRQAGLWQHMRSSHPERRDVLKALGLVLLGSAIIYGAGHVLVNQIIYFADLLHTPPFLLSLLVLSIGTNLPELTLILRSVVADKSDVAFGDYLGSAAANVLLFGIFALIQGRFELETTGFGLTFFVILFGIGLYSIFGRTGRKLTRREAIILMGMFGLFAAIQAVEIVMISPDI